MSVEEMLTKWKSNKWEYIIKYVEGVVKVTIGVLPNKHVQPKYAVGIGEDELDAMVVADKRAEEVLTEWNSFENEIKEMGRRKFPY